MDENRFRQQPKGFREITPGQRVGWMLAALVLFVGIIAAFDPASFGLPF